MLKTVKLICKNDDSLNETFFCTSNFNGTIGAFTIKEKSVIFMIPENPYSLKNGNTKTKLIKREVSGFDYDIIIDGVQVKYPTSNMGEIE